MKKIINLTYEKETPGTFRFKEEPDENDDVVIGTLYIKKRVFEGKTRPESIKVTIEFGVEESEV